MGNAKGKEGKNLLLSSNPSHLVACHAHNEDNWKQVRQQTFVVINRIHTP